MRIRVSRLDRYILGEVLGPFIGGVVFFSFIFLMFQLLRLAEFFIVHGVSGWVLIEMTGLLILSFLPMALPVAFLIGVLACFGRFSADSELVAMKAHGISLKRLSYPVVALGVIVALFSLALNLEWVPRGDQRFRTMLVKIGNTKVVGALKEGTFSSGFFDLLVYADKIDPVTKRMYGVFIYNERDPLHPHTIVAEEGEIVQLKTASELATSIVLRLYRGSIHSSDADEGTYDKVDFTEDRILLQVEEGRGGAALKPRVIPFLELLQHIRSNEPGSRWARDLRADLSRRIAIAFSPLIFVFLGIGYGVSRGNRNVRAGAALIAFTVIVAYWILQATSTTAAQKGWIDPYLALQLPNVIALAFAIRAFRSANW